MKNCVVESNFDALCPYSYILFRSRSGPTDKCQAGLRIPGTIDGIEYQPWHVVIATSLLGHDAVPCVLEWRIIFTVSAWQDM